MFLHLQSSYSFINELVKSEATSHPENDIYCAYLEDSKYGNKRYGRGAVFATWAPYLYACGKYKGYAWKFFGLYAIVKMMDAIVDTGMYLRFFVHGPKVL